jgi:hypothetical protein
MIDGSACLALIGRNLATARFGGPLLFLTHSGYSGVGFISLTRSVRGNLMEFLTFEQAMAQVAEIEALSLWPEPEPPEPPPPLPGEPTSVRVGHYRRPVCLLWSDALRRHEHRRAARCTPSVRRALPRARARRRRQSRHVAATVTSASDPPGEPEPAGPDLPRHCECPRPLPDRHRCLKCGKKLRQVLRRPSPAVVVDMTAAPKSRQRDSNFGEAI